MPLLHRYGFRAYDGGEESVVASDSDAVAVYLIGKGR